MSSRESNFYRTTCLCFSKRNQLLHMQMAGRRSIGSNSLNGLAHRNEQESPQSGHSGGFRSPREILPHSLATISICYIKKNVNQKLYISYIYYKKQHKILPHSVPHFHLLQFRQHRHQHRHEAQTSANHIGYRLCQEYTVGSHVQCIWQEIRKRYYNDHFAQQ